MKTNRLALLSILAAIALVIFVAEAQIPPIVPIPGVKLGLANIITIVAMSVLGRKQALMVLVVRLILGSVFTGSVSALFFSVAGAALSFAVMAVTLDFFGRKLIWVTSIISALAHNAGQLLVAIAVTKTVSIAVYAPALAAAGIITGAFTGLAAGYIIRIVEKLSKST